MHLRNQSENTPLQQAQQSENQFEKVHTQITHECTAFRDSPSDPIVGVSPDIKTITNFYNTPPTENKYQSPISENEILFQQPQFKDLTKITLSSKVSKLDRDQQNQSYEQNEQDNQGEINKGKFTKYIFIVDCLISLISIIIPFISFIEYKLYSQEEYSADGVLIKQQFQSNDTSAQLRKATIFFSVFLSFLIGLNFKLIKMTNDESLIVNEDTKNIPKKEEKLKLILLIEVLFNLLSLPNEYDVPIQGRSLGGEYRYSLNTIFTIINILKSYHIFKIAFHFASSFQFFSFNISFLFKAAFHKRPFLYTFILFFFTCSVSTLCLHIVEINYKKDGSTNQYNFGNLYNTFWVMINTLLTVGFGDGYPYTHVGRGICIILAILGTVFIGILVAVFNKVSVPNNSERLIQQEIHIEKFQEICAIYIQRYVKYNRDQSFDNYVRYQLFKDKYSLIRKDPFFQSDFDGIKQKSTQEKIQQKYGQVKDMIESLQNQQSILSIQSKLNKVVSMQSSFLTQLIITQNQLKQNNNLVNEIRSQ